MTDYLNLLTAVLERHDDHSKWNDSRFERIKRISNSKVGDVGQEFIELLCQEYGIECEFPLNWRGQRARQNPWDMRILGVTFEVKTATEDVGGAYQFNHIRHHRDYQALLCLGISPEDVHFGAWRKGAVAEGMAGNLVSMERGGSASFKLTKRPGDLYAVHLFGPYIRHLVSDLRGERPEPFDPALHTP